MQICVLCQRQRPVFSGDDEIKVLPELSMTPFLRNLKKDTLSKQRYLGKVKVSQKMIRACSCGPHKSLVHSYCMTVFIFQTNRIYCDNCNESFKLYSHLNKTGIYLHILRYILVIVLVLLTAGSICVLDGHIKCTNRQEETDLTFSSEQRTD